MHATMPADVHRVYEHGFNVNDVDSVARLYDTDAVIVVEPGSTVCGRAAIQASLAEFFAIRGRMRIETVAVIEAGDTALLRSRWDVEGTGPDGSPVALSSQGEEVVRRCADGSWRFVIDNPWAEAPVAA